MRNVILLIRIKPRLRLFLNNLTTKAPRGSGGCMKFHWFNLMPWPYLPDDFTAKHRSVWVDADSRLFDARTANGVY